MSKKLSIKDITYIAICATLIVVCSWITVPILAVPFTMQTFAVFTALNILGGKKGTISIMIYILLGIIGLPVFSNFSGGIAILVGPTGGYIWGFLLQGVVYIIVEKFFKKNMLTQIVACFIGMVVCYICGTIWFVNVYSAQKEAITYGSALMMCVVPFIIPDLLKLFLSIGLSDRVKKIIGK